MSSTGLPARIAYTVVTFPLGCVTGFYIGVWVLTRVAPALGGGPLDAPGWTEFVQALGIGLMCGATVGVWALTLPGLRKRKRRGRPWRMTGSAVLVFAVSAAAEVEGLSLGEVVGLMTWLALLLTVTFIRYGVLDRRSAIAQSSRGAGRASRGRAATADRGGA